MTPEDMDDELWMLSQRAEKAEAINADLLAALEETMEWISNWSPRFTDDDEWQETQDKIDAAIAKAKE